MNLHETRKELVNFIVQKAEIKQILKITPSTHQFPAARTLLTKKYRKGKIGYRVYIGV